MLFFTTKQDHFCHLLNAIIGFFTKLRKKEVIRNLYEKIFSLTENNRVMMTI